MDPLLREIAKYQRQKEALSESLSDKETQLAEYTRELQEFEYQFLIRLAPLHQQLHRWERRCTITKSIIQKLESMDWQKLPSPTELSPWIQEIESTSQWEDIPPNIPDAPCPLNSEERIEAKTMYKALARRFHPDLIDIPELQHRREMVMSEINEAYRSGDIQALRELEHHPDIRCKTDEDLGEKWARLVREIAILERRITDSASNYQSALESDLAILMEQRALDSQADSQLEDVLHQKIQRLQERWLILRRKEEQSWLMVDGQ